MWFLRCWSLPKDLLAWQAHNPSSGEIEVNSDINVLAVDDIQQNLLALEALLRRPGVNILKASSGEEALELLLEHDIALALIDVHMPQMDGFELADIIRGNSQTRNVPLIFLTAGDIDSHRSFHGYRAGAVDFLYKPIDREVLQSKVDIFVRIHQQKQQLSAQLEELRQAMQLNDLFAAVLGHDLRNSLSTIMSGASLIPKISHDPKVVSIAERMQSSGRRMSRMADQLLDIAQIRSAGVTVKPQEADIEQICRRAIEDLGDPRQAARVALETMGDMEGMFDQRRVSQILSNLVSNALLHGEQGGPVRMSIDGTDPAAVVIRIANRGTIPFQLLPDIFKPFHLRREIRSSNGGLGLGLYIARELARAHGGMILVRSTERDGTEFEVSLPRRMQAGTTAG
jgi:two-component system, sensor histidine kinase and response regulator